ncbi:MAG: metal-dependent hydrolase [Thermoleophilia bacterium]|nr:metal-dependent hydrolase [Thermoleophilia bacterium]
MDLKGNSVTWLGHGTWLWTTSEGKRILVDPFLQNNPVCPDDLKQPGPVDGVLVTHGHIDHIADLVGFVGESETPVFASWEVGAYLIEQGAKAVTQMGIGGTIETAGVRATMVFAAHGSGIGDSEHTMSEGGGAAGFMLHFPDGLVAYHAGDTDVFGDMALLAEIHSPDVAILPIGDLFTMGPERAVHAVRLLGVKKVLCGHWGTFPPLTGTPGALRKLVPSDVEVPDLEPGSTFGASA